MKKINGFLMLACLFAIAACGHRANGSSAPAPTQVVYRFDDHRYLELTGFNCEGGLTYTDTKRNIHSVIYENSDRYRIYTKNFIHPSERYIVIPVYGESESLTISKDFGQTWEGARFSPGGGADPSRKRIPAREDRFGVKQIAGEYISPIYEDIVSFTVIHDQGFLLTKWGDIYMSSKPFDADDPEGHGDRWGKEYASWNSFAGPERWTINSDRKNFQDIPNKVPTVKNYTGWSKMRCDPDLGLPADSKIGNPSH